MNKQIQRRKFLSIVLLVFMAINVFSPTVLAVGNSSEKVVAKPLVIMMEYQDYKFEDIDEKESKWRLRGIPGKDYTPEFVQELLFGDGYYEGEDGQKFMSVREYYNQITDGAYDFKGKVVGPYTAKHNAAYYGSDRNGNGSDQDEAMELVREAVHAVAADPNVDLEEFDVENRTGDGQFGISDGVVDTVIVVHPGIGEEWGGGSLEEDAIWPFRCGFSWYLENDFKMEKVIDNNGQEWYFDDFVLIAQDSASDMLCHEYGHVLGLPDLYATDGVSTPPVDKWCIMGGSYTGKDVAGTMPNSYGAYCREFLQKSFEERKVLNPRWANYSKEAFSNIGKDGMDLELHQAHERLDDTIDLFRIDLPEKETVITTPVSGKYAYFSGNENNLRNWMKTTIDLSDYEKAKLEFKAWYKIDPYFDFATVRVNEVGKKDKWETVEGNITTTEVDDWIKENESEEQWYERNPGHGITDESDGWVDAKFDLSDYCGKKIELTFYFWSDENTPEQGIYIDDIVISGVEKKLENQVETLQVDEEQDENVEDEQLDEIEEVVEIEEVEEPKDGKSGDEGTQDVEEQIEETESEEQDEQNEVEEESVESENNAENEEAQDVEEPKVEIQAIEEEWKVILEDNAEGEPKFDLSGGFTKSTGKIESDHYYLLEWRNSEEGKVDEGLRHIHYEWPQIGFDPGLLVWYVNEMWITPYGRPDQDVVDHPGECFAGVVDADQNPIIWETKDGSDWAVDPRGDFMMHDAAFSLREQDEFTHEWSNGVVTKDNYTFMVPEFDDRKDYTNPINPQIGLKLPEYGLKILVTEENKDRSRAKVHIMNSELGGNRVDYSDGLNVKDIKVENDEIIIEAENNGSKGDLGEKAYIGYIMEDNKGNFIEPKEKLIFEDGVYKCSTNFLKDLENGTYQVNFIILEDGEGNVRAIYNSKVHCGYGMDLSNGNICNSELEKMPVEIKEVKALDKKGTEKTEFDKGNVVLINTTIDIVEEEKVDNAVVIIEVKDKNGVPYALRCVPLKEAVNEYSLGFSTYEVEEGENTVDVYVWDNLNDRNALSQTKTFTFTVK